jgi:hypothetical protein
MSAFARGPARSTREDCPTIDDVTLRRLARLLVPGFVALSLLACGEAADSTRAIDAETSTTALATTIAGDHTTYAYVLGSAAGSTWVMVSADDRDDHDSLLPEVTDGSLWRSVGYERHEQNGASGSATVITQDVPIRFDDRPTTAVDINGVAGTRGSIYVGDGAHEDAVTWSPTAGVFVALFAQAVPNAVDIVAFAREVQPLDAAGWAARKKGVQYKWHDARVDPASARVEVLSGQANGRPWTLTAVVPPNYPLGPWDKRQTCAELKVASVVVPTGDCGQSFRLPLAGADRFFVGIAAPDATAVTIRTANPAGTPKAEAPTTVALSAIRPEVPVRMFAGVAPAGSCFYEISGVRNFPATIVVGPPGSMEQGDPCFTAASAAATGPTAGK